jgi:hypothetical protein
MPPMADHRPTSSPLLQLIDALNRTVDAEHHTRVISDALQRAGLVDIPDDRGDFRQFVSGNLKEAVETLLGEGVANELTWTLMRMTSVRAPSSRAPRSSGQYQTAAYTEDAFAPRSDVLLIDPGDALFDELRLHLEARSYRVEHVEDEGHIDGLSRDAPPRFVLTNIELSDGLRCAEQLQRVFGDKAPRVLILTEQSDLPPKPAGVERILSGALVGPVVAALVDLLGPR